MVRVALTNSMGELFIDPEPEWLRRRLDECDPEFWEDGAGDCGLDFELDGEPHASMTLVGRSGMGFLVSHSFSRERTHSLVGDQTATGTVAVSICGEPVRFFKRYVATPSLAWAAVEHFLSTGDRTDGLAWELGTMPDETSGLLP